MLKPYYRKKVQIFALIICILVIPMSLLSACAVEDFDQSKEEKLTNITEYKEAANIETEAKAKKEPEYAKARVLLGEDESRVSTYKIKKWEFYLNSKMIRLYLKDGRKVVVHPKNVIIIEPSETYEE